MVGVVRHNPRETKPGLDLEINSHALDHLRIADVRNVPIQTFDNFRSLGRGAVANRAILYGRLVLLRLIRDVQVVLPHLVDGQSRPLAARLIDRFRPLVVIVCVAVGEAIVHQPVVARFAFPSLGALEPPMCPRYDIRNLAVWLVVV